jgi:hypothetical protein
MVSVRNLAEHVHLSFIHISDYLSGLLLLLLLLLHFVEQAVQSVSIPMILNP